MKKQKIFTRLTAVLMAVILTIQPMLVHAEPVIEDQLTEIEAYLTELYGSETAALILANMMEQGLIAEDGSLKQYNVVVDGVELSAAEVAELVKNPDTDLSKTCTVDGQELTLQDIKYMVEIEEEIARIQAMIEEGAQVELTDEHLKNLEDIENQFAEEGMPVMLTDVELPEAEKAKERDLVITMNSSDVTINSGETVTVTFTLSKAVDYEVAFAYKLLDGEAVAGVNYELPYEGEYGIARFAAGETTTSIVIQTIENVDLVGKDDATAEDYANYRWSGYYSFYVKCIAAIHAVFEGDTDLRVSIKGSYDYKPAVLNSQFANQLNFINYYLPLPDNDLLYYRSQNYYYSYLQDAVTGRFPVMINGNPANYIFPSGQLYSRFDIWNIDSYAIMNENAVYVYDYVDTYEYVKEGIITEFVMTLASSTNVDVSSQIDLYINRDGSQNMSTTRELLYTTNLVDFSEYPQYEQCKPIDDKTGKIITIPSSAFKDWGIMDNRGYRYEIDINNTAYSYTAVDMLSMFWSDTEHATIESITAPAGTYYAGDVIPITVTFSEPVTTDFYKYINHTEYKYYDSTDVQVTVEEESLGVVTAQAESSAAAQTLSTNESWDRTNDDLNYGRKHVFEYVVQEGDAGALSITGLTGFSELARWDWMGVEEITASVVVEGVTMSTVRPEEKLEAFTGVSLDKSVVSTDDTETTITVSLDTDKTNWLEEIAATRSIQEIKASVDGGETFIDLDYPRNTAGAVTNTDVLVGVIEHTPNLTEELIAQRLELYVNTLDSVTTKEDVSKYKEQYALLLGDDFYVDYVVEPVIFAKDAELTLVSPSDWPSGKENLIFLTSKEATQLSYTYEGNATYQEAEDFVWSSSDESIATINEDGVITPAAVGEVTFTLTAVNRNLASDKNVSVSITVTIEDGGDPDIVIPDATSKITVVQGNNAVLRWSTNIPAKNAAQGVDETLYKVELFAGNYTAEGLAGQTPVKTYENMDALKNAVNFSIPAEDIQQISIGGVPSYTVKVSVKHPYNDEYLSALAYITIQSPAAVVKLEKPDSSFMLDSAGAYQAKWTLEHFDKDNNGEFEFSVSKNGEVIEDSKIVFDSASQNFTKGMTLNGNHYDGTYQIALSAVADDSLYDIYTINIKSKNRNESTWSYDSVAFYVYNHDALDILVGGAKDNVVMLSNVDAISQMTSEQILALERDIYLQEVISINYGEYAWAQITDRMKWSIEDNTIADVQYQEGGVYAGINSYNYSTYRPMEEFLLTGEMDGQTTISVEHGLIEGFESSIDVTVKTLKNKLYLVQSSLHYVHDVTYTNGNGEQVTKQTNNEGKIAIYEESGIASDVRLKADYYDKVYYGLIQNKDLQSGESDSTKQMLYPVNNVRVREVATVSVYLLKPIDKNDPYAMENDVYEGDVTYRAGVYKNGEYCPAAQLGTPETGVTASTNQYGELRIQFDPYSIYTESESLGTELKSTDELEFVVEILIDGYQPLIVKQNGVSSYQSMAAQGARGYILTESEKSDVYIAEQYSTRYVNGNPVKEDLISYKGKVGPNEEVPRVQISTTLIWDKSGISDIKDVVVKVQDEYKKVPSGQSYKNYSYPFSSVVMTEHTMIVDDTTVWMKSGSSRAAIYNIYKNETDLYKSVKMPFRILNMLGVIKVSEQESATTGFMKTLVALLNPGDSEIMSSGDAFIAQGLNFLDGIALDAAIFKMNIVATDDPTVYNVMIEAGTSNMGEDSFAFDVNYEGDSNKTPGLFDVKDMIKGTYMMDQSTELLNNLMNKKGNDKDIHYTVEGYYTGQIVYNYEAGEWQTVVKYGGFNAGGGGGYHWNFNSYLGPIPITAELGLGAAATVRFEARALYDEIIGEDFRTTDKNDNMLVLLEWADEYKDDEYVNDFLTSLHIQAYFNVFGGLGFDYSVIALKIGAFGKILLESTNTWLSRPYLANESLQTYHGHAVGVGGQIGIRFYAALLFLSYEKILTSAQYGNSALLTYRYWDDIYEYWENRKNEPLTLANLPTAVQLYNADASNQWTEYEVETAIESRDYLDAYERVWNGGDVSLLAFDDAAAGWDTLSGVSTLLSNAYTYAAPELSEDGMLMVYLSDGGEADIAKTTANWAYYNGNAYTDMGPIEIDGTGYGDSSLRIAGTMNHAAAVWVQQKADIGKEAGESTTASEDVMMLNSADVMVSLFNGNEWVTKTLTENGNPDLAPVVAVSDSTVFAAWRNIAINDENNIMEHDGADQIHYAVYNTQTGTWSEVQTLYNGTSGNVVGLQAAILADGTAGVVYTLDTGMNNDTTQYEIVVELIQPDGTVIVNQQLTNDSSLDENPQITTAEINGNEEFVIAWFHQEKSVDEETDTEAADADIYLTTMNGTGAITTAETGMPNTISAATDSRGVDIASNFRFTKSQDKSIENLSIIWTTLDYQYEEMVQSGGSEDAVESSALKAVGFLVDKGRIYSTAALDLAVVGESVQIDHFSAYTTNKNEVRAMMQTTDYSASATTTKEVVNSETGEKETITVSVPRTDMQMVKGSYEDKMTVELINADLSELMKGMPLPFKFVVRNDSTRIIESITVSITDSQDTYTKTYASTDTEVFKLLPNRSAEAVVEYMVPADKVENPTYTVTVTYASDTARSTSTQSESGTLHIATPGVAISDVEMLSEQDGKRVFQVELYNDTEIELAGTDFVVKLGFYEDAGFEKAMTGLEEVEIAGDTLAQIDNGIYALSTTFDIKSYIETFVDENGAQMYTEIPESGVPVYIKAWIEASSNSADAGKVVNEYIDSNNTAVLTMEPLWKDKENTKVETTVNIENDDVTTAEITFQNLMLEERTSENAVITLLNDASEVIEVKYLSTDENDLLTLGSEANVTRTVAFDNLGSQVEVQMFTASADDMVSDLSSLSLSGGELVFDKEVLSYDLEMENTTTATLTAIAENQNATVALYGTDNELISSAQGAVAVSVPLQYTSIISTEDGEEYTESTGKTNQFTIVVTPNGEGAETKTYIISVVNTQKTAGSVVIAAPETNVNGWSVETGNDWISITADGLSGFDVQEIQYSTDGGTNWSTVNDALPTNLGAILQNDGIYTISARAVDAISGAYIAAEPLTVRVDRTVPSFNGTVTLEETDEKVDGQTTSGFSLFGLNFNLKTDKKVRVTVEVSDALSGIASVAATTEDGDTYTLELAENSSNTYTGLITKAYEGVITVTAVDKAGNSVSLNSENILIVNSVPAPAMEMQTEVTADTIKVSASVAFERDDYFKEVVLRYRTEGAEDWTELETFTDAEDAKEFTYNLKNLNPETCYEIQILSVNDVESEGENQDIKQIKVYTAFAAPSEPSVLEKDSTSITLKAESGVVYRYIAAAQETSGNWSEWSTNAVFSNLNADTDYIIEAKKAASGFVPASASVRITVKTEQECVITFDGNAEGVLASSVPDVVRVMYGTKVTKPELVPEYRGYTFTGWYTDKNCENLYDFETVLTEDITLYAGWSENVVAMNDFTITGTTNKAGDWYISDVVIKPTGDWQFIWDTKTQEWVESITLTNEEIHSVNFKLRRYTDEGACFETTMIKEAVSISIDKTAPVGAISVGENWFKKFINFITFGLLFKETVDVKISAEDAGSGIKSVEYLLSTTALTEEEAAQSENWQTGKKVSLTPESEYIVYARITDNADWVSYISTDGIAVESVNQPALNVKAVEVAQDGMKLSASVLYGKDRHFGKAELSIREAGTEEWKVIKEVSSASGAKSFEVETDGLKAATAYEICLSTTDAAQDNPQNYTQQITVYTSFAKPFDLEVKEKGSDFITFFAEDGVEYRYKKATAGEWSDWTVVSNFTGLEADTEYVFEARRPAKGEIPASEMVELKVSTYPMIKVTFESNTKNFVTDMPGDMLINYGESLGERIASPDCEGYTFTGWYTDKACTSKFDVTTELTEDIVLYAGWTENVVTNKDYTITGKQIVDGGWYTSDVTITPANNWQRIWDTQNENWVEAIKLTEEGQHKVNFKLKKTVDAGKNSYTTMTKEAVDIKIDKTAPTGQIQVKENWFKKLLNIITFNIFFKETVDAKITAEDTGSGIKSIEYLLASEALDVEELTNSTDWQTGKQVSLTPDAKYVVYARITDNAGWVTYISTDGIVVVAEVEDEVPGDDVVPPSEEPDENSENGPSVIGDDSVNGWDEICEMLEEKPEGTILSIDMKGTSIVPKEVWQAMKDKDITIIINISDGIYWTINGLNITSEDLKDIDFSVVTGSMEELQNIPLDMLKEVVKEHPSLNVSILYDGEFGFEAELSIYLGTEYANDSADLYYYNELDSKLEYVSQQEIATDGTLKFMFTHASEYAIVINTEDDANVQEDTEIENDDEKADETEKPVDTGVNLWWLIPLLIIVVVIVAYVKNKKQKK